MKSRLYAHIGTFRQLELLLSVHDKGSIKAAAEELHLSQPTISMQMKKLSEAVGLPLYEQIGKKLQFTEAGLRVVATAREVLGSIANLDMSLSDLKGIKSGILRIAVVTSSKYFAPHLMAAFSEKYPGVELKLKVGNREQIIERMQKEMDDFYIFSHIPEDIKLHEVKFLINPLVAIAHKDHPMNQKKSVSLKTFIAEDFISREKGSGTRYAIENTLAKHGLELKTKMTIESNEAIKHAVISGLGVSILSSHSLTFTAGDSDIRQVNVKGLPINTAWHFCWSQRKQLSPIAEAFLDFLGNEGHKKIQSMLKQNSLFA